MDKDIQITIDLAEFNRALKDYLVESSLDIASAINKKAGDVAFYAAKNMPTAVKVRAEIRTDYPRDSGLYNAIATGGTRFGVTKYGAAVKGKGNAKIADKIFNARIRAASYSRFLFLKVAKVFGKEVGGGKANSIKNTKVTKAETNRILNNPKAIFEILGVEDSHANLLNDAVQNAIVAQTKDMREYIYRKLFERAKAHSGRKSKRR